MITTIDGMHVSGVLAVLPETEYIYDEETAHFATPATRRLKRVMGFNKRRAAKDTTTSCDLCLYGIRYLIDSGLLHCDEIGAVLVLSVTPDYYMPQMSNIIHGELGLANDVVCMDISQACASYVLGLFQGGLLLSHLGKGKKVVVCTSDVLCRKSPDWKLAEPSFGGDAATITVLEQDSDSTSAHFCIHNDGKGREALIIHAGGFKMPRSAETAIPRDIGDGTMRSYNDLWMDGSAVFNFVQREVPPMIEEILAYANMTKDDIDWYLFHQPNKFMLQKLAQRLSIAPAKMPMNIVENYGNSSGSCVGVNIAVNLGERLLNHEFTCCLAGFGGGLAWASAILRLGNLNFCKSIISDL